MIKVITFLLLISLASPVSAFSPSGFGVIEEEPEEEVIPEPIPEPDPIPEPQEPEPDTIAFMMENGFSPSGFQIQSEPEPESAPVVETVIEPEPPQTEPQIIIVEKVVEKVIIEKVSEKGWGDIFLAQSNTGIKHEVYNEVDNKVDNRVALPPTGGGMGWPIYLLIVAGLIALMVGYYKEGQK